MPFNDDVKQDDCPARDDTDVNERGSQIEENNGASNINCRATAKDIAERCTKGIKVDDEGPILESLRILHFTL